MPRSPEKEVGPNSALARRAVTKDNLVCTPSMASGTGDNLTVMIHAREKILEKTWETGVRG